MHALRGKQRNFNALRNAKSSFLYINPSRLCVYIDIQQQQIKLSTAARSFPSYHAALAPSVYNGSALPSVRRLFRIFVLINAISQTGFDGSRLTSRSMELKYKSRCACECACVHAVCMLIRECARSLMHVVCMYEFVMCACIRVFDHVCVLLSCVCVNR